ncbi:unnamed protein product [Prorocentrum cordatum]|uniref:Uncharacterized protein n=1 Tax=Prorocentrum cordatum TaxID=2364126 RepID=A0ABN9R7F8_9DINO|nr:unnamed protein product [Polarella glacialis]
MHGKWTSERRRVWAQVLCKGGAAARLSLDGPGMSDELSAPIRLWRGHSGVPVPPEALPQAPRSRWTPGRLRQLMQTIPAAALYPELVSRACDVLERWYERFSLKVWSRFVHFADSGVGRSHQLPKVVKEFNEVAPVLHRLMDWVARSAEAGEPPVAVVDLCSGFGFLSMFASELLPPSAVERIYLVDAAFGGHQRMLGCRGGALPGVAEPGAAEGHQARPRHAERRPHLRQRRVAHPAGHAVHRREEGLGHARPRPPRHPRPLADHHLRDPPLRDAVLEEQNMAYT